MALPEDLHALVQRLPVVLGPHRMGTVERRALGGEARLLELQGMSREEMMQTIADGFKVTTANRDEWLKLRDEFPQIGASEAAGVVGVGLGRSTPIDIWQRKLGMSPPIEQTENMFWGLKLEPLIMEEYRLQTGRDPIEQLYYRDRERPWMTATLDGLTPDGRVVEIKTASSWAPDWGEEGTDRIPEPYLIQVQHQMSVVGADVADVAVLIGGNRFRLYEVPRDDRLINALVHIEQKFVDCLIRKTPPMWGRHDPISLAKLFPECAGTVDLGPEIETAALHYEALAAEIKRLEEDRDGYKSSVLQALGNAQIGRLPCGQMLKRFRQEMPASDRHVKAHVRHYFKFVRGD